MTQSTPNIAQLTRESWKTPEGTATSLKLFNSLTKRLDPVIIPESGVLRWYQCGPTVYDESHLGHARTYVACDIIRRVIEDYFRIPISVVMNITDIDDKIIIKSRESELPFASIASKYEEEFFKDMAHLNVLRPHVLTRVSEFIPEIVSFIEKIIENGNAYASNGSVYFSVSSFTSCGHFYGKLEPESVGNAALQSEGEGALSSGLGKKSSVDFALWKATKEGEPSWDSPWGKGRPGWHIECSAMASEVLGSLDFHLGGEDLRFPHHDNELAQSEAGLGCDQWCNYFVHAGTLKINGQKMSKSLKNFTTIKQALEKYSGRQMRLFFVAHPWAKKIDWSDSIATQIVAIDRQFSNYFSNVMVYLRENAGFQPSKPSELSNNLYNFFIKSQKEVHEYFCNNIASHEVVQVLLKIVHQCNFAIANAEKGLPSELLQNISQYILNILNVLGLDYSQSVSQGSTDQELSVEKLLNILANFRGSIRKSGLSNDVSSILSQCDSLRNEVLIPKGILLEDQDDGSCVWKSIDVKEWERDQERKEAAEEKKRQTRELKEKKQAEKMAKAKISPAELLRDDSKFSGYDERGIPTHDLEGNELSKSAKKKLVKMFEGQSKLHQEYLESL
ncbi:hypothetical protein GEMRC1_011777 [Eukaryota sp. GEM-RC1]